MFEEDCIVRLKFPQKLWYLLNAKTGAVKWGAFGKTILLNYKGLQQYLQCNQSIFKTSRISSFIRQLNLYGFRKVTSHLQDPLISSINPDLHEYTHDFFQYGKSDLLNNIKRKTWNYRKDFVIKLENNKNYCSNRVRRARKNFHRVLKRTVREVFGIFEENENFSEENDETRENEAMNNFILPINMNDLTSYQQYLPCTFSDSLTSQHNNMSQDVPRSDIMDGINLSSYIQNFSVSESILEDTSAIEESLKSTQYSYWQNDASMMNTPQDSIYCDYTNASNTNVKVEVVDLSQDRQNNYNDYHTNDDYPLNGKDVMATEKPRTLDEDDVTGDVMDHIEERGWDIKQRIVYDEQEAHNQDYGSELKELYIQISKSVDLLNSE